MKSAILPATLLASALVLTACGEGTTSSESGDSGLTIAASFYPLEYVAGRIAGSHADIVQLTAPGAEPHDLELSINQISALHDADLILVEHGMQPSVDDAIAADDLGPVVDVAQVVTLHAPTQHEGVEISEEDQEVAEGETDPHFWHDPLLLAQYADAVAAELASLDPDHADDYTANAAALRADLEALDQEYEQGLAQCVRDTAVVSHDAFEYLSRYGIAFAPIAGLSPDAEPNPAQLANIEAYAKEKGVTTVFSESLVSPKMSETLAHDLGLESAVLDPIEGLSEDTADQDYLSLMRQNLDALRKANDCQ